MGVELAKDSIDIGIIVRDEDAALKFYRDTLGLEYQATVPIPSIGTMHRLLSGTTVVKLLSTDDPPTAANPPGGFRGGSGIRYWTITVSNLEAATEDCRSAGYNVAIDPHETRPGLRMSVIEDPDGNWVELIQHTDEA